VSDGFEDTVVLSDRLIFDEKSTFEKKGAIMQVVDYCKAMRAEVTAWKEKLEAMKKVADSYGTGQKEKILPLIGQLEQEVTTAQMRVQQLETECPSDWSPMKNELDDLFGTIGSSVDRAWRDLSPGDVGG
jgi:hypothetical protein